MNNIMGANEGVSRSEIEIKNKLARASVDLNGGRVTRFVVGGRDILLPAQTRDNQTTRPVVRGGSLILFPQLGKTDQDGQFNGIPSNGFARGMPWSLDGTYGSADVPLKLVDTPDTRSRFPYPFGLSYKIAIGDAQAGQRLSQALTVTNTGDEPLPVSPGILSYLAIPQDLRGNLTIGEGFAQMPLQLSQKQVACHMPQDGIVIEAGSAFRVRLMAIGSFSRYTIWAKPGEDFVRVAVFSGSRGSIDDPMHRNNILPGKSVDFTLLTFASV